jgi:hypothetical protein
LTDRRRSSVECRAMPDVHDEASRSRKDPKPIQGGQEHI